MITNTVKTLHNSFIACIKTDSFHGKEYPSSIYLCESPLLLILNTSDTSGLQMCGDFPPQRAVLCDSSWVS